MFKEVKSHLLDLLKDLLTDIVETNCDCSLALAVIHTIYDLKNGVVADKQELLNWYYCFKTELTYYMEPESEFLFTCYLRDIKETINDLGDEE